MKVWLIRQGDPLPIKDGVRLMRTAALGKYLSEHGHQVLWWTSSFMHYEKKYVCKKTKKLNINENEELYLLHSPISYSKNISFRRIIYHKILGYKLKKNINNEDTPDIILCCWPLAEFAKVAIAYGKTHGVPVILDARDQWPDLFMRAFPNPLKSLGKVLLRPLRKQAKRLFSSADGITAMVDAELEWACAYAGHAPGKNDRTIYIGNARTVLTNNQFSKSIDWWKNFGVRDSDWIICFFSTFGSHTAIDTVIKAVKDLSREYSDIKLVLGGGGDREKEFKTIAGNCLNIVFAGWLDNIKMTSLMRIAKCGAFSIKNTFDFKDTFNNKAIQYISEGLPILNSLSGFANTLITERNMGISYDCNSVEDCKSKILELYNNEEDRKLKGINGKKCFDDMYEADVVNQQFEEYLSMMIKEYAKSKKKQSYRSN